MEKVAEEVYQRYSSGGGVGGGGASSGLEARIAKVESAAEHIKDDVKEIKRDLRILLGIALGAYIALAASHLLLSDKIEKSADRIQRSIDKITTPIVIQSPQQSTEPKRP